MALKDKTDPINIYTHLGNVDVADGDVLIGDEGVKIFGETLRFFDIGEVLRGSIFGVNTGCLSIYAPGWILLNPSASGVKLNTGPLFPGADAVQSLGTVGTRWKYFIPISTVGARPAADVNSHGLIWRTREGAGSKTYIWVCVQNDANNYEWVQIGVST